MQKNAEPAAVGRARPGRPFASETASGVPFKLRPARREAGLAGRHAPRVAQAKWTPLLTDLQGPLAASTVTVTSNVAAAPEQLLRADASDETPG